MSLSNQSKAKSIKITLKTSSINSILGKDYSQNCRTMPICDNQATKTGRKTQSPKKPNLGYHSIQTNKLNSRELHYFFSLKPTSSLHNELSIGFRWERLEHVHNLIMRNLLHIKAVDFSE